ncbi:uncharacterized protein LOC142473347 isoform X2 [Ascaphus truei]|uniref:uncharacterized protein LOC142473347 isoform X2 n=1 Tax=Ascaphus truei TaxID=8439 RepID=UPI003F5ACEA1
MALPPALCLLLLVLSVQSRAQPVTQILGIIGGRVTFRPVYTGEASEIIWKFGIDKVVDLEEGETPHFYVLGDRAEAYFPSGNLTITSLVPTDSGDYTAEFTVEGGKIATCLFNLQVLAAVSQPEVSCTRTDTDNVTLSCAITPSPTDVTYRWEDSHGVTVSLGPTYTHRYDGKNKNEEMTCIVSNSVSENKAPLRLTSCDRAGSPLVPNPRNRLVIGIVAPVLCILIIVAPLVYIVYRNPSRGSYEPARSDSLEENPPPQPPDDDVENPASLTPLMKDAKPPDNNVESPTSRTPLLKLDAQPTEHNAGTEDEQGPTSEQGQESIPHIPNGTSNIETTSCPQFGAEQGSNPEFTDGTEDEQGQESIPHIPNRTSDTEPTSHPLSGAEQGSNPGITDDSKINSNIPNKKQQEDPVADNSSDTAF